jgi:hypothetical protein
LSSASRNFSSPGQLSKMRRTSGQRVAAAGILLMLAACCVSAIEDMTVNSKFDNQVVLTAPGGKSAASSKQTPEDMDTSSTSSSDEPEVAVAVAPKIKSASSPTSTKEVTDEAPATSPTHSAPAPANDSNLASAPSLGMSEEMRTEVLNIIQQALDNRLSASAHESALHVTPEDIQAATTPGSHAAESSLVEAIRKAPAGQIIYETPAPAAEAASDAQPIASASSKPASHDAAAAPASSKIQHPWWAGKQIKRISKAAGDVKVKGEVPVGNVTSINDLNDLSDDKLYQIFTAGEPDVPGANDPGESPVLCRGGSRSQKVCTHLLLDRDLQVITFQQLVSVV